VLNCGSIGRNGARQTEAHLTGEAGDKRILLLVESTDRVLLVAAEIGRVRAQQLHALAVARAGRTNASEQTLYRMQARRLQHLDLPFAPRLSVLAVVGHGSSMDFFLSGSAIDFRERPDR